MLYFLQNLLYYISYEVLEPRWHKLMQQLTHPDIKTVDNVRKHHIDFLNACLKECLLVYGPLYKKLYELISDCSTFADRVQGQNVTARGGGDDAYTLFIQRSSVAFDSHLLRFMDALRDNAHAEYHVQLKNLIARLDYNGFYSRRLP